MAETCGGCAFMGASRFAPVKKGTNPIRQYVEKANQNRHIKNLEQKAETEGLSVQEKIDLAANKIDKALRYVNEMPTVMYTA